MTEAEWLACCAPNRMVGFLRQISTDKRIVCHLSGKAMLRKIQLFVCACCRLRWEDLTSQASRTAVEVAERYADGLAKKAELEKVPFNSPKSTVYANVTAAPHTDTASIKRLLVDQVVKPVKWEQTMTALMATPDYRYVELAPGRTLTGLAKKINRRLPVESLATAESLTPAT